jgi:hypothetical protein
MEVLPNPITDTRRWRRLMSLYGLVLLSLLALNACTDRPTVSPEAKMDTDSFFAEKPPRRYRELPPEQHFSNPRLVAFVKAAMRLDEAAMRRLIAEGLNPNAEGVSGPGSHFGFTAMHYAMGAGRPDVVRLLHKVGADPEHDAREMGSPIFFAMMLDSPEWLELLFQLKPMSQVSQRELAITFFEAARRRSARSLVWLVNNGLDIDIRDSANYTLAIRSLDMGEYELTLWLLERGASYTYSTRTGPTVVRSVTENIQEQAARGRVHPTLLKIRDWLRARGVEMPDV